MACPKSEVSEASSFFFFFLFSCGFKLKSVLLDLWPLVIGQLGQNSVWVLASPLVLAWHFAVPNLAGKFVAVRILRAPASMDHFGVMCDLLCRRSSRRFVAVLVAQ